MVKTLELRLLWKSNTHVFNKTSNEYEAVNKINGTDKNGKEYTKTIPRNVYVRKILGDKKYSYVNDLGVMVEMEKFRTELKGGKWVFHITEDGNYEANEADKFNQRDSIRHTFVVNDGEIIEGMSKKVLSGDQVSGGFGLDHGKIDV